MKKTVWLAAAALAVLGAGPGLAADLPMRAAAYKAPAPALYNWTGFYWGANVGYSWGRHRNDWTLTSVGTLTETQDMDGVIGGGQWGYNWQFGNWLLGTETDIQASGQRSSTNYCSVAGCGTVSVTVDHKLPWFGTSRTRLGFLPTPNVLFYLTGGLAYGQVRSDYTITVPTVGSATLSFKDTRAGGTIGAGIEGAMGNGWSAKLEYLYLDFGKSTTTASTSGLGTVSQFDSRVYDHILRIGINYKPGSGFL